MGVFNIHDAKTHLAQLLDRVAQGEEIVIAKRGRPVAKLVRVIAGPRKPGRLKGRIRLDPSFDEPLPDAVLSPFRVEGECPTTTAIPSSGCSSPKLGSRV
jgi:prevent-host-death family protein